MANVPSAVIDIQAMSQPVTGVEEYIVQGFIYDGSGVYDGNSFAVNDYIFDQGVFGCFRWKIIEIITPPIAGMELKCKVAWADEGVHPMPDFGLSAGAGCICSASPGAFGIAQCPSLSMNQSFGMSEIIYSAIQNSNDRQNDIGLKNWVTPTPSGTIIQQCASPIPANTPYAKRPDGKIEAAISNAPLGQKFMGITVDAFLNADDVGNVKPAGVVVEGVLTGLGFAPGDDIFMNNVAGYINNASFAGDGDSIIRYGIADCAAGVAGSNAVNLLLMPQVIARPII